MSRLCALALLGLLTGPSAFAQDSDDPWAQPSDESDEDKSDSDAEPEEGDAPLDPWAPPGTTDTTDTTDTTPEDAPAPRDLALPVDLAVPEAMPTEPMMGEPIPSADMSGEDDTTVVPGLDMAEGGTDMAEGGADMPLEDPMPLPQVPVTTDELAGGNVKAGVRIQPYGASSGVDVGQAFVVGRNGGTNQTDLRARVASGRWGVQLALPFVVHRLPRQPRDTGLGNLQLDVWRQIGDGSKGYTAIGVEMHTNLGSRAYTWVHDADDIWPGTGLDVAFQARRGTDKLTTLWRVALGLRGGQDYAPWANSFVTLEAAAGVDYSLGDRFGVMGEMSVAYWDLSPWDLAAMARADLSPGLRLRGGMVFPVGVWTGISRVDNDFRGFREATFALDLSLAL